jgi:hypothetical protein
VFFGATGNSNQLPVKIQIFYFPVTNQDVFSCFVDIDSSKVIDLPVAHSRYEGLNLQENLILECTKTDLFNKNALLTYKIMLNLFGD